ncbi:hypothetical protein L0V05_05920 [Tabrizicola sp. J26]|uniref:hypothetical protein n=1 Tax=Alitabrizicola rongguiensis TaxID=2909234 RepID=UPI001F291AF6|nr:hypothetical protein [Tabrizicola rongguiensis]MCF1708354.1 hypothetical protein [Tabrizicola rongguiensis]
MRRIFSVLMFLVAMAGIVLLGLGTAFLQKEPLLPAMAAPGPADVTAARKVVHRIRAATEAKTPTDKPVSISTAELESAMRLGARVMPGLRASAQVEEDGVVATASIPLPWITGQRWLNMRAVIPPFDGALTVSSVTVGGRNLPPATALTIGRLAANLILGGKTGGQILDSAQSMQIEGSKMVFALRLDREGRGEVIGNVFGALRQGEMPPADQIDGYYRKIRQAMDDGTLPVSGSFLPHLRFTLEAAQANATDKTAADEFTAAIFGLTKACGARDFAVIVGRLADGSLDDFGSWKRNCNRVTLAGRVDSRLHFITAAAIKAAGNRGLAVSMGEFKELFDQRKGGSSFDFTDIAADNSGIRLSDLFMSAPLAAWPALIGRLGSEEDFLASYDGLPKPIPDKEFRSIYGDINSDAYAAMIAEIESRITQTRLHATPPG